MVDHSATRILIRSLAVSVLAVMSAVVIGSPAGAQQELGPDRASLTVVVTKSAASEIEFLSSRRVDMVRVNAVAGGRISIPASNRRREVGTLDVEGRSSLRLRAPRKLAGSTTIGRRGHLRVVVLSPPRGSDRNGAIEVRGLHGARSFRLKLDGKGSPVVRGVDCPTQVWGLTFVPHGGGTTRTSQVIGYCSQASRG